VNSHSPFTIEVHGTEGTLLFGTPENKILLKTNKPEGAADSWTEIPVKDNQDNAFQQWVHHIQGDTFADDNVQTAVELTRLMEAANRSAHERRVIPLADLDA
jgi:predicted dehydrogenase